MYIHDVTVLSAAARTTTETVTVNLGGALGAHLLIYKTAGSTDAITPKIEALNSLTSVYYEILTGAAITSTGQTTLRVGLGLESSTGATANDFIPESALVTITHATTVSQTYSVLLRKFRASAKA